MFQSIQRWFVDGSVKCFTGGHLPLAIMAMVILLFYLLLVTFVTAVVLKKIKVSVLRTYVRSSYMWYHDMTFPQVPYKHFPPIKNILCASFFLNSTFDGLVGACVNLRSFSLFVHSLVYQIANSLIS